MGGPHYSPARRFFNGGEKHPFVPPKCCKLNFNFFSIQVEQGRHLWGLNLGLKFKEKFEQEILHEKKKTQGP
jgi:hypothetical protein